MNIPKRCAKPLRKLDRLLGKNRYDNVWPVDQSALAARTTCERGDINGLRDIADTLETRRDDPCGKNGERNAARKLAALLRKIEYRLGLAMIDQSHRTARGTDTTTISPTRVHNAASERDRTPAN